jgi:S1-C subfamily serine protease
MNGQGVLKPFFVGIIGAAVGASAVVGLDSAHNRTLTPAAAYAGSEDDQQRIEEAVKHVEPSVVALDVSVNGTRVVPTDPFAGFFGRSLDTGSRLMPYHEQASGSGFVYSSSGFIVTNDHVVHGASKIDVVFANGDRAPGHIFSEDHGADLALVQVDHYNKLPPPVTFGSSKAVQQGEWAIAIGEPYALKQTVTVGVVSGFNRNETIGGAAGGPQAFKGLLQTSAPINPGNSGGPLVDLQGQVIGVNQSVAQPAQGIGFAIPIDTVKSTVAMLAAHPGAVSSSSVGFLGVQLQALDNTTRSELNYTGKGVAVVGVVGGSPADQAGLEPGYVIQSVDGKAVYSPSDVSSIVKKLTPGKTAALRVWNNGTRQLVAVHVGSQPDQSG